MSRSLRQKEEDVEELEEGNLLELQEREPVAIKTNVSYESNYKNLGELGKGKFGVVYKCSRNADGELLAAKFIRKTPSSKEEVKREIGIMNLLHHKRLIQLYDAYETAKEMIIIMELVTGGELFEKVVEEDNLTEKQVIRYMKQVLYGVQHMHRRCMVHLDLKPENILCLGGGKPGYEQIKLIDFGMTRILKEGQNESALCGTPEFVAPEVITFNPITVQADIWSLGVITYVLLSGLSPFMGDDDNETLANVTSGEFDFEDDDEIFENLSSESKQFIEELLVLNPKKRLTVDQCLMHVWLSGGGTDNKINTSNLKKFIARRRWQRTMNTIKAVSRLAGGLSLFGKKAGAQGFGKGGFLEKVKQQQEKEVHEERLQEEKELAERKQREEEETKKKEKEEEERKLKEAADLKHKEFERKKLEEGKKITEKEKSNKVSVDQMRKEEADRQEKERKKKEVEEEKKREDAERKETERQQKEKDKKNEEYEDKQRQTEEERKRKEKEEKKTVQKCYQQNRNDDNIAEMKRKEIEKCNNPFEKKGLIDQELKIKRDEERKRRQEERKANEEIQQINKVNRILQKDISQDDSKTVLEINALLNAENKEQISNNNNNNNIWSQETITKNNSKADSTPLVKKTFGNGSPKITYGNLNPPKAKGIMNKIAAFQTGDIYLKNKK